MKKIKKLIYGSAAIIILTVISFVMSIIIIINGNQIGSFILQIVLCVAAFAAFVLGWVFKKKNEKLAVRYFSICIFLGLISSLPLFGALLSMLIKI